MAKIKIGSKVKSDCCAFGVEEMKEWEKEMMKKHGWFIHFVFDDATPFNTNIHTHGSWS